MTTIKIGSKIISDFEGDVKEAGAEEMIQAQAAIASMKIYDIHARAMAAHCECLGMDRKEKMTAEAYMKVMLKWELVNSDGEPNI